MLGAWFGRNQLVFHDRAYRRADLPVWDDRWYTLSVSAREHLLTHIKPSRQQNRTREGQPPVPADRFPDTVLEELVSARLVTVRAPAGREKGRQVMLATEAVGFVERLRGLRRYHLLDAGQPSEFAKFLNYCFYKHEMTQEVQRILQKAGFNPYALHGEVIEMFVPKRRWPGWVLAYLDDEVATSIVALVEETESPLAPAEIERRLAPRKSKHVRAALEKLITRLVLFEDLDPESDEIVVGLLPSVRADLAESSRPRQRPPLEPCTPTPPLGPEEGIDIPDLLTFLLDLAGSPARLRQNRSLYQKEAERFETLLEPLPEWLATRYDFTHPYRVQRALQWARLLQLVVERKKSDQHWVELSEAGQRWLSSQVEERYAFVYDWLRAAPRSANSHEYRSLDYEDSRFLGVAISAVPAPSGRRRADDFDDFGGEVLTPAKRQLLRDALFTAFDELPLGVFHRLENVIDRAVFGSHNPLLLGRDPKEVEVRVNGRIVVSLEEQLQDVARHLFRGTVSNRFFPLGCLQAGLDASGALLVARRPRLNLYFGRAAPAAAPPEATAATRVVVQPDFSVLVIGVDLSPVAALAPFCERVRERGGVGCVTLRITRASIVKAVMAGLSAEEILGRLGHHSSTPLPGNVVHEVREWAGWVRSVPVESAMIYRCPDAATADRVLSALGRQAEKLSETIIAASAPVLRDADRRKLLEAGIVLQQAPSEPPPKKRGRKAR